MTRVSSTLAAVLTAVLLGNVTAASAQVPRDLRGTVYSLLDSVPLPLVRIGVVGRRITATTDPAGFFTLRGLPANLSITLSRPGFVPDTVVIDVSTDSVAIFMRPVAVELETVAIEVRLPQLRRFLGETQTSVVTLDVVDIRNAPALLEADVLRTLRLMAGTVAKNDYSIGFNVRGGETDQNLIQMDGVTVFNPSHLGGLFSTFDVAAVEDVDFYTGGFSARYGGRLSSVVDIGIRPGNTRNRKVRGQVSLLSSKVLVEGPIGGGTGSYLAGVRRTYADAVVAAFSSTTLPYYFADMIGKVTLPFAEDGGISFTGYWGRDELGLNLVNPTETDEGIRLLFDWGNRLLGINAWHPHRDVVVRHHLSVSEFSTVLGLEPGLIRYANDARLLSARTSFTYHPSDVTDLTVGASFESYDMDFRLESPGTDIVFADQGYAPTIVSAYIDEDWRPLRLLRLRGGLRFDMGIGASDFDALSPRGSFKLFLDSRTALIGSVGRYHQAIHSLRDQEQPLTIFEFWVGTDSVIPVARADHRVIGVEKWFGEGHSLTVELYDKRYDNLITVNRLQEFDVIGDEFVITTGFSRGVDVNLRRYIGDYTGWISYGYAVSERSTPSETFSPSHDRRHTLNIVLSAPGPFGSDMGVTWSYGSALPFTGFTGEWNHREYSALNNDFIGREIEPIGSTLNGERYPPYSRLDLSFRWSLERWGGRLSPYLNIVNAYNRRNVFLYFFDFARSPVTRTGVSQLPFLPTFGVEFDW
ncbi:MAG: TonB-dependent receptor plug domain-containing protein [Gemmatimonadales bacterium]